MALPALYLTNELRAHKGLRVGTSMSSHLLERYRCPEELVRFQLSGPLSSDAGYFRFGNDTTCYGRTATGYRTTHADALLYDASPDLDTNGSTLKLPFDPDEVIDNLRLERYVRRGKPSEWDWKERFLRDTYYRLRPALGVGLRKYLQRLHARNWRRAAFPRWPVDSTVEQLSEALLFRSMKAQGLQRVPFVWFWPRGATACVIMTHDVEDHAGYEFCGELMDIDDAYGIKASLQLVPEGKYRTSDAFLEQVRDRGFEINIQDLNHDGYLFADRQKFLRRMKEINRYGSAYGARGFRAAVLYRNLDWFDALEFSYDMSVPSVAHLDPQHGGCCTVMPYFVHDLVEIPLTTTQDYMLFHLLGEYSLDLWKAQSAEILQKHGLLSFLVHPDYVIEDQPRKVYRDLLSWLGELAAAEPLWFALPGEVNTWWRVRNQMRVVSDGRSWRVEGPGSERAVLAFARIEDDHLEYEVPANLEVIGGRSHFGAGASS